VGTIAPAERAPTCPMGVYRWSGRKVGEEGSRIPYANGVWVGVEEMVLGELEHKGCQERKTGRETKEDPLNRRQRNNCSNTSTGSRRGQSGEVG